MTLPAVFTVDLIVGLVGFLLTVMVLSYLLGDNPAFRVAIYIFIGVSAGYAAAVVWHRVLWPRLFVPLFSAGTGIQERMLALVPFLMGTLLLMKLSPRTARLGSPAVAYLVGVGAAVAVGGAVFGTLLPQTEAAVTVFALPAFSAGAGLWVEKFFEALVMLAGTVSALVYFHFGAKAGATGPQRNKVIHALAWVGQVFIAITFGVLFAGVFMAAITAFVERLNSLLDFIRQLPTLF